MPDARRGEIWLIDLGYVAKTRPSVVVSVGFADDERAIVTFVPRTTSLRGTPYEVPHVARGFEPGAFDAQGISGVPSVKLIRKLGTVEPSTLTAIEAAIRQWPGLA
jgi:mRNA interferase MazF